MASHPEQRKTEIFIGNSYVDETKPHLKDLKTVRFGNIAYDINGTTKNMSHMRPTFISKSEYDLYDRIMVDRQHDEKRR